MRTHQSVEVLVEVFEIGSSTSLGSRIWTRNRSEYSFAMRWLLDFEDSCQFDLPHPFDTFHVGVQVLSERFRVVIEVYAVEPLLHCSGLGTCSFVYSFLQRKNGLHYNRALLIARYSHVFQIGLV